ncbi:NUDIX hydrolase domain-like protein [Melampsora americana]|nr:NUDIX hydrolase domain-like protein [Melampsora americana]
MSSASDQAGFQSTTTVITSTTTTTAITKPSIPSHPTIASSASVFSRMSLEDVLEDLASRFILNLPPVELSQIERVCFQVEQAHWFYEDFVRPNSSLRLPSYNLKTFTRLFFEKCEFLRAEGAPLSGWDPFFLRYKERVPVCGAIILNSDATKVLLVKGYKANSSWSFPRGKINENEQPRDCAIREVLEETGFDITSHMCDDHFIEIMIREQKLRMYLVTGIPDETVFETQTRQEISAIAWFPLADLPTFTSEAFSPKKPASNWSNIPPQHLTEPDIHGFRASAKFYMVVPFVR